MFGAHEILIVDKYKYLGIYLDEHITYDHCIKHFMNQQDVLQGGLQENSKPLKIFGTINTFEKLFSTGLIPILDYGAGIWGIIIINVQMLF